MLDRPEAHDPHHRTGTRSVASPDRFVGALGVLVLGSCLVVGAGCSSYWPVGGTPEKRSESIGPGTLEFESWTRGSLHCAERQCEQEYTIRVPEPGRVRAEVYAPLDDGGPDFTLRVVDESGDEIARPVDDDARPRRVGFDADVGTYVLHISSRGSNEGPLRFEVVTFLTPGQQKVRHVAPKPTPTRDRPPTTSARDEVPDAAEASASLPTTSTPGSVFVRAEVLDVEAEPGGARFVLLDKGVPSGLRENMRGALVEGGTSLGTFVIVEVYQDGCRARIEGELTRQVGIDTVAEIYR